VKNKNRFINWILLKFYGFLAKVDNLPKKTYLYNFEQLTKEIKPGDVLLVESHTRIGNIIRLITESTWTHATLYIGRPKDIEDPVLRKQIQKLADPLLSDQLVIESIIGKGTIVSSIEAYKNDHLRILRPTHLLSEDSKKVIAYAIKHIGKKYSLRHIFDLARFIFPWGILPRRWRSSLFQHNTSQLTEDICSSLIADAFQSVKYPILPVIEKSDDKNYAFIRRNPRLYTPSDFDLSPFFDVIKYPIFPLKGMTYRDLPWQNELMSDDIKTVKISNSKHFKKEK